MGYDARRRLETAFNLAEASITFAAGYRRMLEQLLVCVESGTAATPELLAECREALAVKPPDASQFAEYRQHYQRR